MSRQKLIKKDLEEAKSLEVMAKSRGGEAYLRAVRKDVLSVIDKLAHNYQSASHAELISYCADLRSRLATIRLFRNVSKNVKFIEEELNRAIQEEGETE